MFGRIAFGIDGAADPAWWWRPPEATLFRISTRTGLDPARLRGMTFLGWAATRGDEDVERFANLGWVAPKSRRPTRRVNICRQCIAEDGRPYLRRLWMLGWVGACPLHRAVLTEQCPGCWCVVRVDNLKTALPRKPPTCLRDGGRLAVPETRTAHALVLALQGIMVAGKRDGTAVLPTAGRVNWTTMIAAADMLLGMIWQDVTPRQRERLFDRIAQDVALGQADRAALSTASNYGGLLMLSWLFDDLPLRLPKAIAILRAPRFDSRCLSASRLRRRSGAVDLLTLHQVERALRRNLGL